MSRRKENELMEQVRALVVEAGSRFVGEDELHHLGDVPT
jgi:hypothetical protein